MIIGIDAGKHTGVAVGSAEDPTLPIDFFTLDFWAAYDKISHYRPDHTGIVVEVPRQFMYGRNEKFTGDKIRNKMSSDMGGNRREAELLAARFEALGYPVVRVTPTKTKWTAEQLKRYTGITQRTNEHVRDAIRLVWERIR